MLPDYFIIQPMVRDVTEILMIDRIQHQIQIQSKSFSIDQISFNCVQR